MVLDILFGVLAMMIVAGSRVIANSAPTRAARTWPAAEDDRALQRLAGAYGQTTLPKQITAFASTAHPQLFATHPPIEERIARLQQASLAAPATRLATAAGCIRPPACRGVNEHSAAVSLTCCRSCLPPSQLFALPRVIGENGSDARLGRLHGVRADRQHVQAWPIARAILCAR